MNHTRQRTGIYSLPKQPFNIQHIYEQGIITISWNKPDRRHNIKQRAPPLKYIYAVQHVKDSFGKIRCKGQKSRLDDHTSSRLLLHSGGDFGCPNCGGSKQKLCQLWKWGIKERQKTAVKVSLTSHSHFRIGSNNLTMMWVSSLGLLQIIVQIFLKAKIESCKFGQN